MERISLERARALVVARAAATGSERVATESALGRTIAEPVFARLASPHYRASAMDGIAVRCADTAAAASGQPMVLSPHDQESAPAVPACRVVDTGSPLPAWADAVVRIEDVRRTDGGFEVRSAVAPGRDVRRVGEDIEAGALILSRGRTVRPADIGALLATGVAHVIVRRAPRIGVLATGSEVIEPLGDGAVPSPGQVIEFNSRVLAAYAREWGAEVGYLGRSGDDQAALADAISRAATAYDAVCIIAGSSAGRKDLSVAALRQRGEILFHGVEVMPGGPAAFAVVEGKPAFVVPGYPVSAVVVYRELLRPWIDASLGRSPARVCKVKAQVRRKIASRLGVEELLRVCLAFEGEGLVVAPLPRGASSMSSLARAHGLLRIGSRTEGFDAGTDVEVELLDPELDARSYLVAGGPPHAVTAALEDALARSGPPLSISHLSLAPHDALAALAVGQAHLVVLESSADLEGDIADSALACELGGAAGAIRRCVVLSAALLASELGERVRDALELGASSSVA